MGLYLDNAASTPMYPMVISEITRAAKSFGNPSSQHSYGYHARNMIEKARLQCARGILVHPEEIYYTSGGTEANSWAIYGAIKRGEELGKTHVITTSFEHKSVLEAVEQFAGLVTYIQPNKNGYVSVEDIERAIRPDTALVSVMMVNNELGTIQPISEIVDCCHAHKVLVHTDAVQAAGKIPLNLSECGVDMASFSAHKFHAPKGVGFLYCRNGVDIPPLISGGGQERGMRSGTENVLGIIGMGAAMTLINNDFAETRRMEYRDTIIREFKKRLPEFKLHDKDSNMARHSTGIINFFAGHIDAQGLIKILDTKGFAISNGSACDSNTIHPSHVLKAIGCDDYEARNSFRVSLTGNESREDIDDFINTFIREYNALKNMEVMLYGCK